MLRPNYRGSAGYGNAFLRDVVGNYFKNMHLDVMAGVDAVIRSGIADPDRLAVMGWSAGGHLTNKLITFTNRFKAASSAAGAADWISFFGETDTRAIRAEWFGGLPWEKDASIDPFWNNSPLKDVARVRTPTLLFAGEDDARVPMSQVEEMYRGLVANGVRNALLRRAARRPSVARTAASDLQGQRRTRVVRPVRDGSDLYVGAGARRPPLSRPTRPFSSFLGLNLTAT